MEIKSRINQIKKDCFLDVLNQHNTKDILGVIPSEFEVTDDYFIFCTYNGQKVFVCSHFMEILYTINVKNIYSMRCIKNRLYLYSLSEGNVCIYDLLEKSFVGEITINFEYLRMAVSGDSIFLCSHYGEWYVDKGFSLLKIKDGKAEEIYFQRDGIRPIGFFIKDNLLYVLNSMDAKYYLFDLFGKFVKNMELPYNANLLDLYVAVAGADNKGSMYFLDWQNQLLKFREEELIYVSDIFKKNFSIGGFHSSLVFSDEKLYALNINDGKFVELKY